MRKRIELSFFGVPDIFVEACDRTRAGNIEKRYIGKVWNKIAEEFEHTGSAEVVICTGDNFYSDLAFYKKTVLQGGLIPATKETANILGLSYKNSVKKTEDLKDA